MNPTEKLIGWRAARCCGKEAEIFNITHAGTRQPSIRSQSATAGHTRVYIRFQKWRKNTDDGTAARSSRQRKYYGCSSISRYHRLTAHSKMQQKPWASAANSAINSLNDSLARSFPQLRTPHQPASWNGKRPDAKNFSLLLKRAVFRDLTSWYNREKLIEGIYCWTCRSWAHHPAHCAKKLFRA